MIEPKFRVFDGSVAMRRLLLAAVMFGTATGAHAADMPDFLRGSLPAGPAPTVNWRGFYVGGQYGYGSSDENFNGSTGTMTQALLADTLIEAEMGVSQWNLGLGKQSSRSPGFGGFTGYNWQWDDVVLGLEASYLHGSFGGSASASESRFDQLTDNNFHSVTATSQSSIAISDMATFRARAGYAYGSFLPYVFAGAALGNADITRSITVQDGFAPTLGAANAACSTPGSPNCAVLNSSEAQHNHLIYGYSAGAGFDINLIGGLFLRAEYEYVRFTAQVDTSINTVRAGLGYKF
jgi:outer membrane immunogenic protein